MLFFYVNRALSKIDELFGESTGSSESEEETVADLAAGNRLKRQLSLKSIPAHRVFEQSQSRSDTDYPAVAQAPPTQKAIADYGVEINEDW